ncbi:hypothetical protein CEXT_455751 [Caerostris extrusa]|uniref:Uncharacterized protein n=1 Tax=Caerostris extrusa TaxID=172846 RepID=A0AAV4MTP7_CAEEX|nr:hypothetical protein CEXT_455751 [Caerostris extrusa]
MYMPKEKDSANETLLKESYINMLSDSYFKAPNDKMVKLLLQRDIRTYMYVLNNSLDGLKFVHGNPRSFFGKKWFHMILNITLLLVHHLWIQNCILAV